MLEATVQQREPARVFRGVQDIGRMALAYGVSFPGPPRREPARTHADFTDATRDAKPPAGLGVIVSAQGDVLTHVGAVSESLTPGAQLPDGRLLNAQVKAYEPESGLVLVELDDAPPGVFAPRATAPPEAGELAVAAARIGDRDFVAPVFIATGGGDRYTLSAASGVVVPGTPVFNLAGELLAVAAGPPEVSLAWAVGPALERLTALRASPRALPRSLGLSLQPLDEPLAARLGASGVLVADVAESGPGARAGLRPGDVLEAIGPTKLGSAQQAQTLIAGARSELVLRLRRAGRTREQRVTPEPVLVPLAGPPLAAAGPLARTLFAPPALEAARFGPEARVISIEGTKVASVTEAARVLRRHRPPWLVYIQDGSRRLFAAVAGPPP